MKKSIRIGNAGGFWGDDLQAFNRQLSTGNLDYLTMDFLAEITMSILRKQQLKDPGKGYIHDFVGQVVENADLIRETGTRIITNAGGINPVACARTILSELKTRNISLGIAVVDGDDILNSIGVLYPEKADFRNIETGESFETIRQHLQSANVYLGIIPVLKALESGAEIILTGRVTDTAITMAPMVYELGWEMDDWDRLAGGLVAGHIIECGAQATGGNFTDWRKIIKWTDFGYPIIEMYQDGSFDVMKPDSSGGLVDTDTVREQLLYEMGDPSAFISPDVVGDFTSFKISTQGRNRVRISGTKGYPATPFFKVSMAYEDGYSASGNLILSGPDAVEKAHKLREIFWDRLGIHFDKQHTEFIGLNATHMNLAPPVEPNELLVRFSVYDHEREKLERFSRDLAPMILSSLPGLAVTGGRPRINRVISYWPALINKKLISSRVVVMDADGHETAEFMLESVTGNEYVDSVGTASVQEALDPDEQAENGIDGEYTTFRLIDLCLARSGDKGDTANLGVLARSRRIYEFLVDRLTAGRIKAMFSEHCHGKVVRYELDNLNALNFLLHEALDDGGTRSLRIDAQGKTLAQAFLNQEIRVPEKLAEVFKNELEEKEI